jgi:pimeloyl-ACP methyl ester carboxylesterase
MAACQLVGPVARTVPGGGLHRQRLEHLDLREAVLVGHSMGTGEVTRYPGTRGSARVARGVLVSPIPPSLLQTPDNPEGVPQGLFDGFVQAAMADAPASMKGFLDNFYNFDTLRGTLVSDQAWQASWNLAVTASATAAVACTGTWATDFRADLPEIAGLVVDSAAALAGRQRTRLRRVLSFRRLSSRHPPTAP